MACEPASGACCGSQSRAPGSHQPCKQPARRLLERALHTLGRLIRGVSRRLRVQPSYRAAFSLVVAPYHHISSYFGDFWLAAAPRNNFLQAVVPKKEA